MEGSRALRASTQMAADRRGFGADKVKGKTDHGDLCFLISQVSLLLFSKWGSVWLAGGVFGLVGRVSSWL